MCGRFTQHHTTEEVQSRFVVSATLFDPVPRYNAAPTQPIAVVVQEASTRERILDGFQWGLIPFWAKDPAIGNKLINARSETVAEKPAYKGLLKRRRCIIPADGFYEWERREGGKVRQPFHFRRRDGNLFGFAGLWDQWDSPDGSSLLTCTILTTNANDTVGKVHDRMPVILQSPDDEAQWLDDTVSDTATLQALLLPYPDSLMEAVMVSRRVNSPMVDSLELILPESENG
ncbi:MAG: SOS response-associated peptidase [Armatimonadaceae bacterium]